MLAGHAAPSATGGGEAGGDKAADAATQDGNKSMLVMSGGEGYIDFRMGEFSHGVVLAQFSSSAGPRVIFHLETSDVSFIVLVFPCVDEKDQMKTSAH